MTAAELGQPARHFRPSPLARVWGVGSVFGKGLRDSRWGIAGFGGGLSMIMFITASQVAAEFSDPASRQALAAQMGQLPDLFRGLLGEPRNIETLGGFMSWRALGFLSVVVGIWSVLSLSGSLAGEAARGSLDLVVASPQGRASIAVQKAAAHVVALGLAMLVLGLACWAWTVVFATLPGDEVSIGSGLAAGAAIGVEALAAGAVAFALGPILGRGASAGVGAIVLFGSFIVNGYASTVPPFEALRSLSYFSWTAGHRPLAGVTDWPAFLGLSGLVLVLIAVGVVAFDRRDLGRPASVGVRAPRIAIGLSGPFGRSFGERLPGALAWGVGIGLYGMAIASSATDFAEQLGGIPQVRDIVERFYPGIDFTSSAGVLQLSFFGFGSLMTGLAAATLVGGWASDENELRLETILSTPLTRFGWGVLSGLGVLAAIAVISMLMAALVSVGAALDGTDPSGPVAGILVTGGYGAALGGIGLAVGGLWRAGLAAAAVAVVTIGSYLLDFLGAALRLPEQVLWFSLSRHLGRPLLGDWDVPGMIACGVLAFGGVLVAAWGLSRRDVAR